MRTADQPQRPVRNIENGIDPGAVIEVRWLDSEKVDLGWASTADYMKVIDEPQTYRTAGYLVGRTAEHIAIALSIDPSNGNLRDVISIPMAVVLEVTQLRAAEPSDV